MLKQNDTFTKFAIWVGKAKILKMILRPFYSWYNDYITNSRNAAFRKNGLRVISDFDKCLTEHYVPYTLAFGSMLGAVREHGFIKHDLDMDVAIWASDYTPSIKEFLEKDGFKLIYDYTVEDGVLGREETYEKDNVSIDIFYIYPAIDEYPYCCDFLKQDDCVSFSDSMKKHGYLITRRLQMPWTKEFVRVPFESLQLPVCKNAHDIMVFRYGESYMTPDPNFHYSGKNKNILVWEGKKGIFTKYH